MNSVATMSHIFARLTLLTLLLVRNQHTLCNLKITEYIFFAFFLQNIWRKAVH